VSIRDHGLDAALAAVYNGAGEFWASTSTATADWFARTNPAGGTPARLDFEIPEQVLQQLLKQQPAIVNFYPPDDYEFLPPSFDVLNQNMTTEQVVLVF
jgi:hypothetical protein